MSGALTYIKITWALSPTSPQVPVSLRGPPYAHGVLGTPHGEVHDTHGQSCSSFPKIMEMALISWLPFNSHVQHLKTM